MNILIIALILFSISALAHWRAKKLDSEGFWLYTLKRMPAICAIIGIAFIVITILCFYFAGIVESKIIKLFFVGFALILSPQILLYQPINSHLSVQKKTVKMQSF